MFDDGRLDDEELLREAEPVLRRLAENGARVRREAAASAQALRTLAADTRPRAVVAGGPDARLLRAVLEPWCPVPFVAWPGPGLPGWAGTLDLVVVLAPAGGDSATASAVDEAVRRGCGLLVACPEHSVVADRAAGRYTTVLPTQTDDPLAVAVVVLQALHRLGLGPEVAAEPVAMALDAVAASCSPHRELALNPAKELALVLAETLPLVWGGSVLSARAGRRVAEVLRRSSGRAALAADAAHLLPVLAQATPRDLFADPVADGDAVRPVLVVLDDGGEAPAIREQRGRLRATAAQQSVRVHEIVHDQGPEVARYAALLATGTFAAHYLALGLGRQAW